MWLKRALVCDDIPWISIINFFLDEFLISDVIKFDKFPKRIISKLPMFYLELFAILSEINGNVNQTSYFDFNSIMNQSLWYNANITGRDNKIHFKILPLFTLSNMDILLMNLTLITRKSSKVFRYTWRVFSWNYEWIFEDGVDNQIIFENNVELDWFADLGGYSRCVDMMFYKADNMEQSSSLSSAMNNNFTIHKER